MQAAKEWALETFGSVELGDERRRQRAIQMAQRMAEQPGASLPKQMGSWKEQKASYRLLDNQSVTHAALSTPHWEQTCKRARAGASVVLMLQDFTELDYTRDPDQPKSQDGLGPISTQDHRRGLMVHNTLAVLPSRTVLGLAYQQIWARSEARYKRLGQNFYKRQHRSDLQSRRWAQAVEAIGSPPEGVRWVHVADRESDVYPFMQHVFDQECDFCIRVVQNRWLDNPEPDLPVYLIDHARHLAAQGYRLFRIPAQAGQSEREARLAVAWKQVTLRRPRNAGGAETVLTGWVIRTWELDPPPDTEPLEWLLLTSVPVHTLADALERIDWYSCRPIIEEYHKCLKTGCHIERSQLRHGDRLQRLSAFLSVLAVRFLQLRDLARMTPQVLAVEILDPLLVQIAAHHLNHPIDQLTLGHFWQYVAQLGGFPARKSDAHPGWQRLWHGWLRLINLAEGVRLARHLPPLLDVGNP